MYQLSEELLTKMITLLMLFAYHIEIYEAEVEELMQSFEEETGFELEDFVKT